MSGLFEGKPSIAGLKDIGCKRQWNEDAFAIENNGLFFVVCDGMGGMPGGNVASVTSVKAMSTYYQANQSVAPEQVSGWFEASLDTVRQRMQEKVSSSSCNLQKMGTTMVAALMQPQPDTPYFNLHVAHIGDSRAYRLRAGTLEQLTTDHGIGHTLDRYLGIQKFDFDLTSFALEDGDLVLLCSDGLCKVLSDEAIAAILAESASPEEKCRKLVDAVLAEGAPDNVTAVVAHFVNEEAATGSKTAVVVEPTAS